MAKRKCKECNRVLELNEENFRISNGYFAWKCRACARKRSLKRYYRIKKTNGKRTKISAAKQQRKQRLDAMKKKYRRILHKLKQLGVNPDDPKYTAGEIDEILCKAGFENVIQINAEYNISGIADLQICVAG